jgi:hypothetical protein
MQDYYGPGGIRTSDLQRIADSLVTNAFLTTTCFSDNVVTLYLKISNEFINN